MIWNFIINDTENGYWSLCCTKSMWLYKKSIKFEKNINDNEDRSNEWPSNDKTFLLYDHYGDEKPVKSREQIKFQQENMK